jgi:hypothetical protein
MFAYQRGKHFLAGASVLAVAAAVRTRVGLFDLTRRAHEIELFNLATGSQQGKTLALWEVIANGGAAFSGRLLTSTGSSGHPLAWPRILGYGILEVWITTTLAVTSTISFHVEGVYRALGD